VDITKLEGQDLRNLRRKIGMVFQQFNLVKRSTVLTNVMAGRLGYSPTWRSITNQFDEADKKRAQTALQRMASLTRQTSVPMNLAADSSSG
jgi:phosphonate transport system ATP-binding protein